MEKKELSRREILERLWVTSDELYLVATSKREHLLRKPIGADLINIGSLKAEIKQELSKAREEVIKDLIKKIEEAHCDSISLELLKEIDLSKLKQ